MVWYNQYMKNTKEGVVKIMRKTNVKKISKVKQKMQSNSGITLVALIVTIIVLLILAFISIATLTGENGILGMAKKAKDETEDAANEEALNLRQTELMMKEISGIGSIDSIPEINAEIDGLPAKKTLDELPGYIPIYTPEQFEKIASGETNYAISDLSGKQIGTYNMEPGAKYALMEDLDFSSMSNVKSVRGFTGELEGNGCYIRNVTIREDENSVKYNNIITGEQGTYSPAGLFQSIVNGTVKNLAITNSSFSSYYERVGAIVGHADNTTIENCYVKEVDFQGCLGGGFIGSVGNNGASLLKCKAITLKGNSTAGMVCVAFGKINLKNCQVISTNPENSILTGMIYDAKADAELDSCKIQDIKVTSNGGMIQTCEGTGKLSIKNCTAKRVDLIRGGAGIVRDAKANDVEIDNCKVEQLNMKYDSYENAGIMVNGLGQDKMKITNCTAKDIKGKISAGILYITVAKDLESENCHVENLEMSQRFGGIVNIANGKEKLKMTNCTTKNVSGNTYMGGIVFYAIASDVKIEKCNVEGINAGIAGGGNEGGTGIVGNLIRPSLTNNICIITDCTMKNMNVNGKHQVSGIANCVLGYDNVTIQNCDVDNIKTNSINQLAGIICNTEGNSSGSEYIKIENCNVKNIGISDSEEGQYAGIVTNARQKNVEIQNCGVANVELKNARKSRMLL